MTCYVDDAIHPFGRMLMCHLWADTEQELLRMVDVIGVDRKWIQGHPVLSHGKYRNASWVHFDIAKSKRAVALRNGAKATDQYGPVEHTAKLLYAKGKIEQDPEMIERAERQLRAITAARARRNKEQLL